MKIKNKLNNRGFKNFSFPWDLNHYTWHSLHIAILRDIIITEPRGGTLGSIIGRR